MLQRRFAVGAYLPFGSSRSAVSPPPSIIGLFQLGTESFEPTRQQTSRLEGLKEDLEGSAQLSKTSVDRVYWNSIRAFMILSALTCFAGIITGILSFAQLSTFQRFNRSFVAGILFFVSTMGIYTGVTVKFLGKRFGEWRFS
ncbi:hypothetical protein JD844_005714 [Phrynosoma platyrhinos]|uniref:Uncharacterized protein n=1 Tax=Phrynosoma platyrhinos TaxID=52577 RepID=A0ABQ7TPP6_PHRPL|nr:hypothetical protein JD844_005714 [Phrynosoma platyrhinos]